MSKGQPSDGRKSYLDGREGEECTFGGGGKNNIGQTPMTVQRKEK